MSRVLREASKEKEKESLLDMLNILNKVKAIYKRDDLSEEEKQQQKEEILNEKLEELLKIISGNREISNEKAWDFSKERKLDVFAEDDVIYLRAYRKEDNGFMRRIEKENSGELDCNDDDKVWELYEEWLEEDSCFVCSIFRRADNSYIGYVSVKDTGRDLWEIAIELLAEQCNRGYGARAMKLFLSAISAVTGKTQFQALVETDNIPSQMLMEKLGARLIGICDYMFDGDEEAAKDFEERHLDRITGRMMELAREIDVEPRKMLSHVLDYRFWVEEGAI